jgi:GMP synthase (glutamine-hydrolysing)
VSPARRVVLASPMPRACVLQHIRCEPPGLFTGLLNDRGFAVETIELDEGDGLPDWREVDVVLGMGGPMGASDETGHPWLAAEKEWIAAAVRGGTPYLGVCLGAQLLAASLGAEVRAGETPEVGVLPVEVTGPGRADPVFGVLDGQFPALQWHGDTFAIPSGAVHLGRSAAYPNQAFRFGEVAYAVQFHVEVTDSMLSEWRHVPAYQKSAEAVLGADGFQHLAAAFAAARDSMARTAAQLFTAWLDLAAARHRPGTA